MSPDCNLETVRELENGSIIQPPIKRCCISFFFQCVWQVLMMMEAAVFFVRKEPTMGNSTRHLANHVEQTRQPAEQGQHLVMSAVSTNQTKNKGLNRTQKCLILGLQNLGSGRSPECCNTHTHTHRDTEILTTVV